jgi:hypothetical protein
MQTSPSPSCPSSSVEKKQANSSRHHNHGPLLSLTYTTSALESVMRQLVNQKREGEKRAYLIQQTETPQLAFFICHWIVQRMRPHVAPEAIQPHLLPGGARARDLKDTRRDLQRRVCGEDLDAGHPLRRLAARSS